MSDDEPRDVPRRRIYQAVLSLALAIKLSGYLKLRLCQRLKARPSLNAYTEQLHRVLIVLIVLPLTYAPVSS